MVVVVVAVAEVEVGAAAAAVVVLVVYSTKLPHGKVVVDVVVELIQ